MTGYCELEDVKRCIEFFDKRSRIVIRDKGNRQKYIGRNTKAKKFCLIKVDACLIVDGNKCDYLLVSEELKKAFFIELKGSDLSYALKQIESSINHIKPYLGGFSLYARVVLNKQRVPDLKSTAIIKFEKMMRDLNGNLKRKNNTFEEDIS